MPENQDTDADINNNRPLDRRPPCPINPRNFITRFHAQQREFVRAMKYLMHTNYFTKAQQRALRYRPMSSRRLMKLMH